MFKPLLTTATLLATAITLSGAATANDDVAVDTPKTRIVTDFRGKPPFKRRVVSRTEAVAEQSSTSEAADDADSSDRILVVERRGAPPYKRRFVDKEALETAEFARFEETNDSKPTRRGPPGKMTSRR